MVHLARNAKKGPNYLCYTRVGPRPMNIERLYFKIPEIFRVIKKNDIDMKFQNANCRLYETNNLEVCKECSTCDEGTNMMMY